MVLEDIVADGVVVDVLVYLVELDVQLLGAGNPVVPLVYIIGMAVDPPIAVVWM